MSEFIRRFSAGRNIDCDESIVEKKKESANLAKKKEILNKSERKNKQGRGSQNKHCKKGEREREKEKNSREKEKTSSLRKGVEPTTLRTSNRERLSDRGGKAKDSSKRKAKRKSKRKKHGSVNKGILNRTYAKSKQRMENSIDIGTRSPNRRSVEEGVVCPAEISTHIDVTADYGYQEVTAAPETFVLNNENNGDLFVNGVPFWMLKDEKLPDYVFEPIVIKLKEVVDGKLTLLDEETEPKDLDPFNDLSYMMTRDYEYFNKPNKLLSNTLRSLITSSEFKDSGGPKSEEMLGSSTRGAKVSFVIPSEITHYNRKNHLETMRVYYFVPGQLVRQRSKRSKIESLGF